MADPRDHKDVRALAEMRAAIKSLRALGGWRDDAMANDGWADEAASVAWGEVREIATAIPHAGAAEEDGLDDRGVDYELRAPDDDLTHAALSTPEGYVGAVSEAVAEELERLRADLAALRIEHDAWGAIIDCQSKNRFLLDTVIAGLNDDVKEARRERDNARAYIDDTGKRIDVLQRLLCNNDSALPQDIRDTVKLGHHVVNEAARVLLRVAGERDELRAALLNERGEGEPPSKGWRYEAGEWVRVDATVSFVLATAIDGTIRRRWEWGTIDTAGQRSTARDAMKAADAALAGAKL